MVGFIDPDRSLLEIEVSRRERQEFSLAESAPVQHLEGVVRERFIHNGLREFQILLLRPEEHFIAFLASDGTDDGGWIALQTVVPDRVVQDGDHLIMDALQVGIGIRLFALIPEGQQFILPGDDILGVNLADDPLPEGWDQLLLNHVFLGLPGACLQARTDILFI